MRKFVILGLVGFCSIFAIFYFFDLFHTKQIVTNKLAVFGRKDKKVQTENLIAETQSVDNLPQELKEIVIVIDAWKSRASSAKQLQEKLKTWRDFTVEKYDAEEN